jgi:hypothetical protein
MDFIERWGTLHRRSMNVEAYTGQEKEKSLSKSVLKGFC